uniref:MSP domain-containing protein n=1 Tax=Hydatigena taeniaeformis TaxID=6205 RepID=A0A0R3WYW4_HYDTA
LAERSSTNSSTVDEPATPIVGEDAANVEVVRLRGAAATVPFDKGTDCPIKRFKTVIPPATGTSPPYGK